MVKLQFNSSTMVVRVVATKVTLCRKWRIMERPIPTFWKFMIWYASGELKTPLLSWSPDLGNTLKRKLRPQSSRSLADCSQTYSLESWCWWWLALLFMKFMKNRWIQTVELALKSEISRALMKRECALRKEISKSKIVHTSKSKSLTICTRTLSLVRTSMRWSTIQ